MTLLYTPTFFGTGAYVAERQYCKWLALEWLPGCVVQLGNPYVVRENLFGGYEVHIRFEPSFFAWDSGGWRQDEILLDYYATAPGSSVPIPAGPVGRIIIPSPDVNGVVVSCGQAGGTGRIWVFRLPPPPTGNWYQHSPDNLPDVFCLQQPNPGVVLPAPMC